MSKSNALYMDELETAKEHVENLVHTLKLALEYWEHKNHRYTKLCPVWVTQAHSALELLGEQS